MSLKEEAPHPRLPALPVISDGEGEGGVQVFVFEFLKVDFSQICVEIHSVGNVFRYHVIIVDVA